MPTLSPHNAVSVEGETWRINLAIVPVDCEPRHTAFSSRRELVTMTVSREDYAKLKAVGGPRPAHIDSALRQYLSVMKETPLYAPPDNPAWRRGPVVSFLCAIPRQLCDEIRSLSGRFDSHTIRAFRLFFL
jgi:hypothetical protein